MFVEIYIRRTMDMGTKTHFFINVSVDDARATFAQAVSYLVRIQTDRGNDAEASDGDPAQAVIAHRCFFSLGGNNPTRRPAVV